jgi:hypothetical protein
MGSNALRSNTTASLNTVVGYQAAYAKTTASSVVAVGAYAGTSGTTGSFGTYVGVESGYNVTGVYNTAIGYRSLNNGVCTGAYNSALGANSLYNMTSGSYNVGLGNQAGYNNTTGNYSVAVGSNALFANSTGAQHTAVGYEALNNATDNNNTAVGYQAGKTVSTGYRNVLIGSGAGVTSVTLTTGGDNVVIGADARTSSAGGTNQIVIGASCTGFGNDYVTIGKNGANIRNHYDTDATWTQASDQRLKKNIEAERLGLSFINRLNPVTFNWKSQDEIPQELKDEGVFTSRKTSVVIHGLLAQDVKAAMDAEGCNTFNGWEEGPDTIQSVSREMFITPLIKAIQELKAELDSVRAELATLKGN